MTLVLELPDKKEAALKAKAQVQNVSAEQYAQLVLDRDLEDSVPAAPRDDRPIWEVIAEIMADVPPQVLPRLPRDGASRHDHYIYGWPKRDA